MKKDLTQGSVAETIKMMAVPVSIGMFFQAMYNVTDAFFVAQLSTEALAGLALTFPLYFLILSLGSGVNIATNAFVAKRLGEKKHKEALEIAAQGIVYAVLAGIVLSVIGLAFSKSAFELIGGKNQVLNFAIEYMNIIFLGSSFFMVFFTLNGILSATGDTKTGGKLMVLGFLVNAVLDPIFMFGWFGFPAMGISGVAFTTVLIQLMQLIIIAKISNNIGMVSHNLKDYIPKTQIAIPLIKQGIPASLNQASTALGFLIITKFVADFGNEAIATFGIGGRVDQLIVLPAIGIAIACISLVGQNYGAKRYDRILEAYKTSIKYGSITLIIGVIIVILFAKNIAGLFTTDEQLIEKIVNYLSIVTISYVPFGILIISGSTLQGLAKAKETLVLNLMRIFGFSIPLFWIFAYMLDLKETGIWIGIAVSSVLVAMISYWYVIRTIKKLAESDKSTTLSS